MGKLSSLVLTSVVGVAVVTGCTEQADPRASVPFADGTRLKAVHFQIDGAPPYFLNWYDSELGVDCSFVFRKDRERLVCFPFENAQPYFAHDAYLFADSGCSQPVVGSHFPGESRYILRWDEEPARCETTPRLFRVGAEVPRDPASLYTTDSTGACVPATGAIQYSALHLLGPEVPIDTLVSGSFRHDAGSARIAPLAIDGSDGSMQGTLAFKADVTIEAEVLAWDNTRQEIVSAPTSVTADSRWYPLFTHSAGYFLDATCTTRAADANSCVPTAKAASTSTTDVCGRRVQGNFFDVGPRLGDAAPLYHTIADTCVPAVSGPVTDPAFVALSVAAPIPLTSFADAIEVHTGTAQLRVVQVGSSTGPAMGAFGLYDSVTGQPCTASLAADETVRCLPATIDNSAATYFADERCSVPLLDGLPPDDSCAPTPTFVSRYEPSGQAGVDRRHVYPIGARHAGMAYLQLPGIDCLAAGDVSFLEMFVTGPEIPAAAFAPMNLVRPN